MKINMINTDFGNFVHLLNFGEKINRRTEYNSTENKYM